MFCNCKLVIGEKFIGGKLNSVGKYKCGVFFIDWSRCGLRWIFRDRVGLMLDFFL